MSQLVPINRGDLQEVRLRPAPTWSRALTWGIIGTASFGFIFALVTRIDEVVPAQGQLEPVSSLSPSRRCRPPSSTKSSSRKASW